MGQPKTQRNELMAKKKEGAPTKYKPEYCKAIIEYFSVEPYKLVGKKEVANDLPFITAFAHSIDVTMETLQEWRRVHPEFSEAYAKARQLQESHFVTNSLRDNFAQPFAIFAAKNMFGWRDRSEVVELKFVLDLTGKVVDAINRVLPDKCPHCNNLLAMKKSVANEMVALSKQFAEAS